MFKLDLYKVLPLKSNWETFNNNKEKPNVTSTLVFHLHYVLVLLQKSKTTYNTALLPNPNLTN